MHLKPQAGPQTEFARCSADMAFFASMPGAGKSWALCLEALRWVHLPQYTGVLMRAEHRELVRGPTSLFGNLRSMGGRIGLKDRQAPHPEVYAPGAGSVLCLHGNTALTTFDGLEIALLGLDEAAHFELDLVRYLSASRLRSTSGVRPYVRGSVMPTADTWVHELAKPWLDSKGYAIPEQSARVRWFYYNERDLPVFFDTREDAVEAARAVDASLKPQSLAFIFAKTQDNHALMRADPEYVERLSRLPAHERDRLLYGCWEARPSTSGLFDRAKWRVLDEPIRAKDIKQSVRGWDIAATLPSDENPNPDWTRGVRLDTTADDMVCVSDVVSRRDRPGPVNDLIRATARADGPLVTQSFCRDPGAAGVRDEEQIRQILADVPGCGPIEVQPSANKVALASVWSAWLSAGRMALLRAAWNGPYLAELDKFPSTSSKDHDDQVDATSYAFRELILDLPESGAASLLLSRL